MGYPVYSVNLGVGKIPAGWWDFCVPPPNTTWVIREMDFHNDSQTPTALYIYLLNESTGLSAAVFIQEFAAQAFTQWQGRINVPYPMKLQSLADQQGTMSFATSGYSLSSPPASSSLPA